MTVQVAGHTNDSAWSILYGAMINQLGLSPQQFQLLYPMVSWNWPVNTLGFTNAAQYNFCATMPQWSATGAYASSASSFDQAYIQFLNCIAMATTNPALQAKIQAAENALTKASNQLQLTSGMALSTYDSTVKDNQPTYSEWLGTPAGVGFAVRMAADQVVLEQAQAVVNTLAQQQTTPNLSAALNSAADKNYYTKFQDPTLNAFPLVPSYSLGLSSSDWVQQVLTGGSTGGSLSFANTSATYDYHNTWAKGSASVGNPFFAVQANGGWQEIAEFYTDTSLQVDIKMMAWDMIPITPGRWYSGTTALANGPYKHGFAKDAASATSGETYMFGKGGLLPLLKTGMLVCYQPEITITCSSATYNAFQRNWSAALGLRVGPFCIEGSAGSSALTWSSTGSLGTLKVASRSNVPLIFGVTIAQEPV